jgi:hypothetical protein
MLAQQMQQAQQQLPQSLISQLRQQQAPAQIQQLTPQQKAPADLRIQAHPRQQEILPFQSQLMQAWQLALIRKHQQQKQRLALSQRWQIQMRQMQ